MAELKTDAAPAAAAEAKPAPSLLNDIIDNTNMAERSEAQTLIEAVVKEALKGTKKWDKNVSKTISGYIQAIDDVVSKQLAAIMHHPDFQKLEGSWRGLNYLVMNSETGTQLKVKVLNVPKKDLFRDVNQATNFDQSQIFKKLYENEFGMPGGVPYGALVGDYEFSNHPDDISLLGKMSNVAAMAFCPFVSAASPALFGFKSWTELRKPPDLAKLFDSVEYTQWRSYRESEDSRFVTLVLPRVLARLPYGAATNPTPENELNFEEVDLDSKGQRAKTVKHDHYTWMNASYVFGARLTDAFKKYGWCTAIRGKEGGGKVEGLPAHITTSSMDGDAELMCPTEIGIPDRREKELSDCGFLPLCHWQNSDFAAFVGAQTTQKPQKYSGPNGKDASANAEISARLPYVMATSRIAHYLKVIARDWIGTFLEASDCERQMNTWIQNYVTLNANDQETKARYPLKEAKIVVEEIPGKPGYYNAKAWLRPWLQMEGLTTALMTVAQLKKA